jgi:hypothetical protein
MKKEENILVEYLEGKIHLSSGEEATFCIDSCGFQINGLEKDILYKLNPIMDALSQTFAEQVYEMEESSEFQY